MNYGNGWEGFKNGLHCWMGSFIEVLFDLPYILSDKFEFLGDNLPPPLMDVAYMIAEYLEELGFKTEEVHDYWKAEFDAVNLDFNFDFDSGDLSDRIPCVSCLAFNGFMSAIIVYLTNSGDKKGFWWKFGKLFLVNWIIESLVINSPEIW